LTSGTVGNYSVPELEFPGGGRFCKTKTFGEMFEAEWELLEEWEWEGGRGDLRENPFHGGGADIFWNYIVIF